MVVSASNVFVLSVCGTRFVFSSVPFLRLYLVVSILLLPLLLFNIYKALPGGCHFHWYKTLFYKACMLVII